jgi:hypothetical protein
LSLPGRTHPADSAPRTLRPGLTSAVRPRVVAHPPAIPGFLPALVAAPRTKMSSRPTSRATAPLGTFRAVVSRCSMVWRAPRTKTSSLFALQEATLGPDAYERHQLSGHRIRIEQPDLVKEKEVQQLAQQRETLKWRHEAGIDRWDHPRDLPPPPPPEPPGIGR